MYVKNTHSNKKMNVKSYRGCRRCMTCNIISYNHEVISWPGFVDTESYFAIKRFRMKMVNPDVFNWVEQVSKTNELANKRKVRLSVRIPDTIGTGLNSTECVSIGVIETCNSDISIKTIDIKDTKVSTRKITYEMSDSQKIQRKETTKISKSFRFSCFSCFLFF